jgi:hypothetical protein
MIHAMKILLALILNIYRDSSDEENELLFLIKMWMGDNNAVRAKLMCRKFVSFSELYHMCS